jgi:hypothetical protein
VCLLPVWGYRHYLILVDDAGSCGGISWRGRENLPRVLGCSGGNTFAEQRPDTPAGKAAMLRHVDRALSVVEK